MLRIGYLPSDYNPMVLMLGEIEDLRLLAGVLRRFAREQADMRLDEQGFCAAVRTAITLTAWLSIMATSSGGSTPIGRAHSLNRSTCSRFPRALPARRYWNARPRKKSR